MSIDWKIKEQQKIAEMIDDMTKYGAKSSSIDHIKVLYYKIQNFKGTRLEWSKIVNTVLGTR
jgi:hypothetical protein